MTASTIRDVCEVMERLPVLRLRDLARRIEEESTALSGSYGTVTCNSLAEVIAAELEPPAGEPQPEPEVEALPPEAPGYPPLRVFGDPGDEDLA